MSTINPHTTRAAGTILTAAIYNADHVNHVSNAQNLNADKLEGATPPVVDGHAVLWLGTTGAALKTSGYAPANVAITITAAASGGLTGGGDLSANRTLAADFASQAEAEAAASATKVMSPLRVRQWFDHANAKASQAEAEAAAEGTKWISPLRWRQAFDHANQKASTAEAQAGSNDTKWLSAAKVNSAIQALVPAPVLKWAAGTGGTVSRQSGGFSASPSGTNVTISFGGLSTPYAFSAFIDQGSGVFGASPVDAVTGSSIRLTAPSGDGSSASWKVLIAG